MKMCDVLPPNTDSLFQEPCAYTQCPAAGTAFEYLLRFGDGSYARIDRTGPDSGRLEAKLQFSEANDQMSYRDLQVTIFFDPDGDLMIGRGSEEVLSTKPCGEICAGINADDFGQ